MSDTLPDLSENEPTSSAQGCAFIAGLFGGFFVFLGAGWFSLVISNGTLGAPYMIFSSIAAFLLVRKPGGLRGFAIGIFLGLGAILLLMSICGHMGPIAP
jgi:hypothetical protein